MPKRESVSKSQVIADPRVLAVGDSAVNSVGLDADQCNELEVAVVVTAVASNKAGTIKLQESDVLASGYADVDSSEQIGDVATDDVDASGVYRVSYIGSKKYVRVTITPTGSAVGISAVVSIRKGRLESAPADRQV